MKTLSLFSQAWSNTQILIIKNPDCFFLKKSLVDSVIKHNLFLLLDIS